MDRIDPIGPRPAGTPAIPPLVRRNDGVDRDRERRQQDEPRREREREPDDEPQQPEDPGEGHIDIRV